MGPRSCERGNAHTTYYQCYVNWASMGPRSCERGNVVELGGDLFWKLRFNGAALVRARKCRIAAFWPFAEGQLQWGRARASAEISCNAAAKGHVDTASMGPRSCERGNSPVVSSTVSSACRLQWGRARASAEMGVNLEASLRATCF